MNKLLFVTSSIITFFSALLLGKPRRERDYGSAQSTWDDYNEDEHYI